MKRTLAFLLTVLMAFSLTACGSAPEKKTEYADKVFIQDLAKGLERRFDAVDKSEKSAVTLSDADYAKQVTGFVDIELNTLSKYRTSEFEDHKLQEYAISYVNSLDAQKEALTTCADDRAASDEKYSKAQAVRIKLLLSLATDYGLSLSDRHQKTLDEMKTEAKTIIKDEEAKTAVDSVINNLNFQKVEESYGWKTYRATLENTSGYDIGFVSLSIDLIDAGGVVISQTYASADNVTKGKKVNVEFTTDANFVKYEISSSYNIAS